MRIWFFLFFLVFSCVGFSQVEIHGPIRFIGQIDGDRIIKNIGNPSDSTDGVNVQTFQSGVITFAGSSGKNNINLILKPLINKYQEGLIVHFIVKENNTGPVNLNINDLGSIPLRKGSSQDLDSAELVANQFASAIFDGTNFQLLTPPNKPCPAGFADVAKDYCIEKEVRDTATFWQAIKICGDINSRLCTMGEWAAACKNAGLLGISSMTTNYEWVDSAANKPTTGHTAKIMGKLSTGVPGCNNGYIGFPADFMNYRCCFSK